MKRQAGFRMLNNMPLFLLVLGGMLLLASTRLFIDEKNIEGDFVEQMLVHGKPTLAEFGSDTCSTCISMAKVLHKLELDYGDQLSISTH